MRRDHTARFARDRVGGGSSKCSYPPVRIDGTLLIMTAPWQQLSRRWSVLGTGVVVLAVVLVSSVMYVALARTRALGALRIAVTQYQAASLRADALAHVNSRVNLALARTGSVETSTAAQADGSLRPLWLGRFQTWTSDSPTMPVDENADLKDQPGAVIDMLLRPILMERTLHAPELQYVSSLRLRRPVTIVYLPPPEGARPTGVSAALIDLPRLRDDLLATCCRGKNQALSLTLATSGDQGPTDPAEGRRSKESTPRPPDEHGVWSEPLAPGIESLRIEPSPALIAEQRRDLVLQGVLFTAVALVFLVALAVFIRRFLRLVETELALSKLKSDFVADVSHELKTPLALIRMFSESLQEGRVPTEEKKREYYGVITRESIRLTHLLDGILDFSRIEAGKKRYEMRTVDVGQIVRATYDTYAYDLDQKGFEHALSVAPDLPAVQGDADAIGQAVLNLISNAVKYSHDPKRLEIDVRRDTRRGNLGVLVSVQDEGIGISPEDRARIFDGFYRAGDERVRKVRGTGLGLSLVKHIVEAHGGTIDVESRLVKGTAFRIFLPVSAPATDT